MHISMRIYLLDRSTDHTLYESNSSSNNQSNTSRRYKRSRTNNNTDNNNTTFNNVTDDTDSTTQTPYTNEDSAAVYAVDRKQYEVDCILGKMLLIFTVRFY